MAKPEPEHVTSVGQAAQQPMHDARRLTDENGLAHIALDGQIYTLRITRACKLILTK